MKNQNTGEKLLKNKKSKKKDEGNKCRVSQLATSRKACCSWCKTFLIRMLVIGRQVGKDNKRQQL